MFKNYIPYSNFGGIAASFLLVTYVINNPIYQTQLINFIWEFWDSGILGYWYVGKLFFLVSILLTYAMMWFFGLFKPKSTSFDVLRRTIDLIGFFLIVNSSSNKELAIFILICLGIKDSIKHFFWTLYLYSNQTNSPNVCQVINK